MFTKRLTLLYAVVLSASATLAQDSLLLRNYQFVQQQDAWLSSTNAAALTRFASRNIALAELSLTKGNGKLVDYYESPNTLEADAAAASYYRLNRRTVVYGSISYNNFSGRDMTGSAFMHLSLPNTLLSSAALLCKERYPFDIVEDSLTNAGDKHRDVYRLAGAVGVDIWRGYALGLRLDYTAANYAKYRDLRHKNKLMDLLLTASVYAPILPWLNVGAGYQYHRNTESLSFSTYGKNDKVFKSLIDYGAFLGRVEQFGNEGYTDKSREMPLFEDNHGGSLQIGVQPLSGLSALASLTLAHGTGYYGRRSPYTITYSQHDRDQTALSLAVVYQSGTSRYRLDFSYADEQLQGRAETFRELTNDAGANYYEYYDPVETADKEWKDLTLGCTAYWGIRGELPVWQLQATYQWGKRWQAAYLFPFYRMQELSAGEFQVNARYNLVRPSGIWSFALEGGFRQGSGKPYEDGTFQTPSDRQGAPATMVAFLQREYRYLTAPQYRINAGVQYAFLLPGTRLKTHIRSDVSYHKANADNEYCLGNDHTRLTLAVGCTF